MDQGIDRPGAILRGVSLWLRGTLPLPFLFPPVLQACAVMVGCRQLRSHLYCPPFHPLPLPSSFPFPCGQPSLCLVSFLTFLGVLYCVQAGALKVSGGQLRSQFECTPPHPPALLLPLSLRLAWPMSQVPSPSILAAEQPETQPLQPPGVFGAQVYAHLQANPIFPTPIHSGKPTKHISQHQFGQRTEHPTGHSGTGGAWPSTRHRGRGSTGDHAGHRIWTSRKGACGTRSTGARAG